MRGLALAAALAASAGIINVPSDLGNRLPRRQPRQRTAEPAPGQAPSEDSSSVYSPGQRLASRRFRENIAELPDSLLPLPHAPDPGERLGPRFPTSSRIMGDKAFDMENMSEDDLAFALVTESHPREPIAAQELANAAFIASKLGTKGGEDARYLADNIGWALAGEALTVAVPAQSRLPPAPACEEATDSVERLESAAASVAKSQESIREASRSLATMAENAATRKSERVDFLRRTEPADPLVKLVPPSPRVGPEPGIVTLAKMNDAFSKALEDGARAVATRLRAAYTQRREAVPTVQEAKQVVRKVTESVVLDQGEP